ncbi:MAG: hypothetical protein WA123_06970, partial [Methylotenera sp.]
SSVPHAKPRTFIQNVGFSLCAYQNTTKHTDVVNSLNTRATLDSASDPTPTFKHSSFGLGLLLK